MRVQRILMPDSETESWTLLGDDQSTVEPAERFLAYLSSIEHSPNTVKAYAHDLKDWFSYLARHQRDWRAVKLDDVAGFVAWLRLPPAARDGGVALLPSVEHHCSESSVNRKLAALTSFYEFHARHGVELAGLLVTMQPSGRRGAFSGSSYKPFLHHVAKSKPQRRRMIKLKAARPRPQVLTVGEVQSILDACEHLRDRLLFAVLLDTGLRIGEALGLRHEDLAIPERQLTVTPRRNDNGARAKAGQSRTIPTSAELMRLYADYLNAEYGALDSDYVFVNLWGGPHGHPLTYAAVYDLVVRLRRSTGTDFEPHHFRHTYATWLLRKGAGMEREGTARARLHHHHDRHLRPPHGGGRPADTRGRRLVHRPGGASVTAEPAPTRAFLLETLMTAVRPEFRVDILTPDRDDPVLGWKLCAAAGCDRPVKDYELCNAHSTRWRKQDRPDLAAFMNEPGPPQRGRAELARCTVLGCRYGVSGQGLCARRRDRWARSGCPDPAAWAATVLAMDSRGRIECRLSFCTLWCENANRVFCKSHETRWRQRGRPNVEEFIAECERLGKAYIDFRGLPPELKLELQYAVQCRHDEQSVTVPPRVVMWAIRRAKEAGVKSLLDRSEEQWRQMARLRRRTEGGGGIPPRNETFLIYARDAVETLRDGAGWESEYPRDIWRMHKLGGLKTSAARPQGRSHLRFDRIAQPWLKDLAKRWVRLRLTSGLAIPTAMSDVQALTRFSEFLSVAAPAVDKLAGIDRPLLERYLAWLATQPGGPSANEVRVNGLHLFLRAIRQYNWDDTLPTTAAFFTGDCPRRTQRIDRHLAEFVMAQVERPANLDRWPHPEGRLVTLILIRCGMRVSDACTLPFDCLLHDGQEAPYLRYVNHKMNRQAAVPIDEELQAEIRAQQGQVLERWPDGNPHLFPRQKANANGQRSFGSDSYRKMLNRWLASCDIRDEHGQRVHLTPHQWRHTFATRLINRDVPQEVVRVLLDHESIQMTAHYARITDQTVRRRWEVATRSTLMVSG